LIIDGVAVATGIELKLKKTIASFARKPALAFIRVGEHPPSLTYIRMKQKKCVDVGIISIDREFGAAISQKKLLAEIDLLNRDPKVDGILLQLPLPSSIDPFAVLASIDPAKDVDGFHPLNVGKLLIGQSDGFFPCTPYGIVVLLSHAGIDPAGKHVVILGRSNLVGKPLAALLMQKEKGRNATVTVAHSQSRNLVELCQSADILVAAMGVPLFVKEEMVKPGSVVIDVGITRTPSGLVGDVDFASIAPKCAAITPVPGGVGPMTVAMLLSNTVLSFERREAGK
jgi:methylenetetrahydrofolate dehydrogenase (NADP+)/methenyltetrahydrofolate cyclohydrolase